MTNKNYSDSTEGRTQQDIVGEINNSLCLVFHDPRCMILSIPNAKNPLFSATGMYPGAADLELLYITKGGRMRVVFMEVKTPTGKQSKAQILFQKHCKQTGLEYHIVRSVEDALAVIALEP